MVEIQQETAAAPSMKAAAMGFGVGLAVASVVFAVAIAVTSISRPATGTQLAAQPNSVTSNAAVEFRAAEHALQAPAADPFLTNAAIEFRAGEQGTAPITESSDLQLTRRAIDFRAAETPSASSPDKTHRNRRSPGTRRPPVLCVCAADEVSSSGRRRRP